MFTIRFIQVDKDHYKSYSVVSYEVTRQNDGGAMISLSKKLNGNDAHVEFIGEQEQFAIAYITNVEGKTIDVVKQIEQKN